MKAHIFSLIAVALVTPLCLAQVTPGTPEDNGLIPRTDTFDVNTNLNNTSTESTGVSIAANGNVIIGWEDDSTDDVDIFFFGAVWSVFDNNGDQLNPVVTIENTPGPPPYDVPQTMNTFYRAFFRTDGTPTPGNTAWGPKIKANLFGDGMGMGATAYFLGREVPEFVDVNVDAGGGDDFPAVQLLNNDGTPNGIVTVADADAETTGGIRIGDWEQLSNGNIVIVGESRQNNDLVTRFGGSTARRHVAFRIVTPAGVEVKGWTLGSASNEDSVNMWHGVGVTANGFALRFEVGGGSASPAGATVRMFDNAGNPTSTNLHLATLTGEPNAGGGGRGDGAGFHGNGTDAYVHIASAGGTAWLTVLSANGTVRWVRKVADAAGPDPVTDRVDAAMAPDGRVIAVWDDNSASGFRLPQGRLYGPAGDPLGGIFWLSDRDQPAPGGIATAEASHPRAAWRDNQVAVIWESLNSPATFSAVVSARIFTVSSIGAPEASGVTPRTGTFDVNTNLNNTSTESTGVSIAGNGNVIIGWEDDSTDDVDIFFFGAVWSVFNNNGGQLNPVVAITNTPGPAPYDIPQSMNTFYRAFFRANGTPTPGNTAWGPKIKANRFGNGMGMGATAYFLGREVPGLADVNIDAGGGGDFPAVQLLNNDGTPSGIVTIGDAGAEPAGDIRIADWEYLANGNIVIVGESRQADDRALTGQSGGNIPVYRIVTPAGVEVKGYTAVSSEAAAGSIWHGVGVTANGFAVRFDQGGATVRMFDNAGNPTTTNIHLATLTGQPNAGGGGRGDGAGFHGNGTDAYVHIASGGGTAWITVLNANGTLRWVRKVGEDFETISSDRVDAAISPDGRVFAVFDENNTAAFRLPQGRLFSAAGVPIGTRFWLSERDQPAPVGIATATAQRPRAAWRDNVVAVIWESVNSPATFSAVVAARLFNVPPASVGPSAPRINSIVNDGPNVTFTWSGGGPTYSVTRRSSVTGAPATLATGLTVTTFTTPKTGAEGYYQVTSP